MPPPLVPVTGLDSIKEWLGPFPSQQQSPGLLHLDWFSSGLPKNKREVKASLFYFEILYTSSSLSHIAAHEKRLRSSAKFALKVCNLSPL